MTTAGWFVDLDRDDVDAAADRIRDDAWGVDDPADWPAIAVDAGFAADEDDYYEALHEATLSGARAAVRERERADDRQLIHAVRTMDDLAETTNELAERVAEWGGSLFAGETDGDGPGGDDGGDGGVPYTRSLVEREPTGPAEERAVSLARRVVDLADERDDVREFVERQAPAVAPNLSMLAGSVLAARLIELAGGLESLAKMPSGTVQVLGAEDALFAHLRGHAPSPKHGVIFTHEYVRNTHPDERGSAARALAGKLTIAARIDHYAGDRRPDLQSELDERIARIRSRREEGEDA